MCLSHHRRNTACTVRQGKGRMWLCGSDVARIASKQVERNCTIDMADGFTAHLNREKGGCTLNSLTQKEIQDILNCAMQDITNRMTSISPCEHDAAFSGDICTVHTTFEGGHHATLTLYMDMALLQRLTQRVMQQNQVEPQDVEDFTKEYFNVICGQVASKLFQTAHIRSRFCIPRFCRGRYVPKDEGDCRCVLDYVSNCKEGVQLIHQILPISS